MTARGIATAGPTIAPIFLFFEGVGEGVEVVADSAMTLVFDDTIALEPPPGFVTTDVTRTTEVLEDLEEVGDGPLTTAGEMGVEVSGVDLAEATGALLMLTGVGELEELGELVVALATGATKVEVESSSSPSSPPSSPSSPSSSSSSPELSESELVPLTIARLLIWKRTVDVWQHPLLESPSASGRLASQQ